MTRCKNRQYIAPQLIIHIMHHAHITFRMIGMEYPVNNKQNIRKPKNVIKIKIKSAYNPYQFLLNFVFKLSPLN